ncbi:MazG-like family protein [Mechercharimyces sp. CAU 1602]|uniref:MazG-like family protein n=1 Tax=Mechercharimyces sp. CAU 1602 TaxID=2973933 RepID=UPI00216230A3|nr:MazG-like family protein [Mechercharimyces sp. CAU 1602]MCS1352671.1 MazG-like family protein [Mechercharimyces sp. CAU 1602]
MSRPDRSVHIAKSVKVIDWLKTELIDQLANLFKGLHYANQTLIVDSLASLITAVYVLARRLGLSFRELDQAVVKNLQEHVEEGHQLEEWYQDLSHLEKYIDR